MNLLGSYPELQGTGERSSVRGFLVSSGEEFYSRASTPSLQRGGTPLIFIHVCYRAFIYI